MSDVMNSAFGRTENENPDSVGYGAVEPEPEVAEAIIVVEEADSAPEHESATETAVESDQAEESEEDTVDVTGTDEVAVAEDSEVDDTDPNSVEDTPAPVAARPAAGTRGSTTIADGVVGKIVVRIAAQADGVYSLDENGIKVELADDVAWITIPVVVEFGHAIKALGEKMRVAVIEAVEQYLGLDVEVVDVHVTDIHFPEAD
ncbi:Asp23/Gls24 family envelope stress response protein [Amycolatopsis sp. NPDC051045]|uniref:Asp23/Gls24 family envelope stress response protein n=1 Tax=Amycolatopsis sp. NPDC051045 TaxID=3156922 RepID=UPI0034397276